MDLKDTYNRIAEDWHRDHQQDDWWLAGTDRFISLLKPGALVLDVGCGGGTKAKYLVAKGLRVVGIDFSEEMIKIAVREVPAGKFLAMDMRDVDRLTERFDGIFMQASLLHVPKKEVGAGLKKMYEKLNPGGYLYIALKEKRPGGPEEEIKREDDYGYPYERFFSYFCLGEVEGHLKKLGMNIIYATVTPSGNTRWAQVIGKRR